MTHADFYVCYNLHFIFGYDVEWVELCPKCGNKTLAGYASMEAQHLLSDIEAEYGEKFASAAAILLAAMDYPTLMVEIRDEEDRTLKIDRLMNILKKNKEIVKRTIEILKDLIKPSAPVVEIEKVI